MKNLKSLIATVALVPALMLTSCDDSSSSDMEGGKGMARLEATDAAVDAENISGVFLSVQEAQFMADGQIKNSIMFDSPKEFNLMSYQNGETILLGETDLDEGSYDGVRLILNSASQAYVEFKDGTTQEIKVPSGSTSGYKVNGDFDITANGMTQVVVDVDLRKALVKRGNGEYNLRPTARLITKTETGMIEGSVDDEDMQGADRVVVYAYLEGTYSDSEMNEPADGSARFEGAINSAITDANGNFTLAFMPEGDYELIVATYGESETDDSYDFQTATHVEVSIDGELTDIFKVKANAVTSLWVDLFN